MKPRQKGVTKAMTTIERWLVQLPVEVREPLARLAREDYRHLGDEIAVLILEEVKRRDVRPPATPAVPS